MEDPNNKPMTAPEFADAMIGLGLTAARYYSVLTGVYAIYRNHAVGINNSGDALPCTPEAGESNGRSPGAIFRRDSDHGSAYYRCTPDHIGWIARKPTNS